MFELLRESWWVFAVRGAAAVLFGLIAILLPGMTLALLIGLFGGYAIVDGILSLVAAVRRRHEHARTWMLVFEGVSGLGAGIVTWLWPGITAFALVLVIAAWAIVTGVMEITAAIRLRKEIRGEFWLALAGVASIGFGLVLMLRPGAGALALLWLIGIYAFAFGLILLGLSLWLRSGTHAGPSHLAHS